MIIDLKNISVKEKMDLLQHAIAPRPIALVSTINKEGNPNLSPFSYFNIFSSNPPMVIFSPVRRVRNGESKHTRENLYEVPEAVINIVDYDMVQQVNLSSAEYGKDVNEFTKAGFTSERATTVRPQMVKESPVKLECRVKQIKSLGDKGGAGTLVICEVLVMHMDDKILESDGKIGQRLLRHVARLGRDWYCKITENNLFKIPKLQNNLPMGIDNLPGFIVHSNYLTGNQLAMLASLAEVPKNDPAFRDERMEALLRYLKGPALAEKLHAYASELMEENKMMEAWQVLLRLAATTQKNNTSAHAV